MSRRGITSRSKRWEGTRTSGNKIAGRSPLRLRQCLQLLRSSQSSWPFSTTLYKMVCYLLAFDLSLDTPPLDEANLLPVSHRNRLIRTPGL